VSGGREVLLSAKREEGKGLIALALLVDEMRTFGFALDALPIRRMHLSCYRSPGVLVGYTETGIERSSAVRMIRDCSATWAAG